MVQKQPLTTLRKPQAAVAAARSVSVSHQLVRMVLKTLENSRKKWDLVHARPFSTEITTTAFFQHRHRIKHRDISSFQSMGIPWDETIGSYTSIRGIGSSVYVRSNSMRTRTLSILETVDSFGSLSFARREGAYHSIHFAESSWTVSWRLATSLYWKKWPCTIPLLLELLPILSTKSCFSFLHSLYVSHRLKECFSSRNVMIARPSEFFHLTKHLHWSGIPDCVNGYWHSAMRPSWCTLPSSSITLPSSRISWSLRIFCRVLRDCLATPAIRVIPLEQMQRGDRTSVPYHWGCRLEARFTSLGIGPRHHSGGLQPVQTRLLPAEARSDILRY